MKHTTTNYMMIADGPNLPLLIITRGELLAEMARQERAKLGLVGIAGIAAESVKKGAMLRVVPLSGGTVEADVAGAVASSLRGGLRGAGITVTATRRARKPAKAAKPAVSGKPSAADFIRSKPNMSGTELAAAARLAGHLNVTPNYVYAVRAAARKAAGTPGTKPAKAAPKAAKKASKARRAASGPKAKKVAAKRTPEQLRVQADLLTMKLASGLPQSSEYLQSATGLDASELQLPLKLLLKERRIRKTGVKRATRYSLAPAKPSKHTNGTIATRAVPPAQPVAEA